MKKIRDYAFVHYEERESAVRAVEAGEQQLIDGKLFEILSLIKVVPTFFTQNHLNLISL